MVRLGTPKQQAIFAILAVQPGRLVTLDDLVDELWVDCPPRSAVANVRTNAANLRRTFEAVPDGYGAIDRQRNGYRLVVDPERVDVFCFELERNAGREALTAGRLDRARELLERALARWRGPMLAGVPPRPVLASRTPSYRTDRLTTVTEPAQLSHVDRAGAARMVDVSAKAVTGRLAVAAGRLRTTPEVIDLLHRDGLPKGDALAVGRLAGIMGAKRTPDLIPLCHPIALHGVTVDLQLTADTVEITATARTADRTGVEMEALTAVAVAGLALIDMVKAVDPAASVEAVRVLRKEGGKTGEWVRPEDRP